MAGLLGAIATHEPQWLDEYLEPKEDFRGQCLIPWALVWMPLQVIWKLQGAFFAQTFDNYFVIYVDLRQFTSIYMPTCVDLCQFTSIYVDLRLSMYKDGQGDSPNMLKQKHK